MKPQPKNYESGQKSRLVLSPSFVKADNKIKGYLLYEVEIDQLSWIKKS